MATIRNTPDGIARAAEALRRGDLVAFPTETVYGLGALASDAAAVAHVYAVKGRPAFNPLIAHVAGRVQALALGQEHATLHGTAERLAAAFWPGPLTLVLKRHDTTPVCELACAGLTTIAVRVPSHPVAQGLLAAVRAPVVAPSANRSGRISPTRAAHVAEELAGADVLILEADGCAVGLESTVVSLTGDQPVLLRPGAVTVEDLAGVLGLPVSMPHRSASDRPEAPGQLASHYAPRADVRLDAECAGPGEARLAFGPTQPAGASAADAPFANLSPSGDLVEAAANLYAMLRALDATGVAAIAVAPIPDVGLGAAINDRLRRAAAPRPEPRTGP